MGKAEDLSLADFYFDISDDPLEPSQDYLEWRKDTQWATGLYEPNLLGAPEPRVEILRAGKRRSVVNLTSYNYMGLVKNREVIDAAKQALDQYGTGACGSPLLSGLADLHSELEQRISRFMGREDTMLFNSGFGGAMGALAGLLRKGDVAVLDEKCHLALIAGGTLSRAKVNFFQHNDPASLDEILAKTSGKRRLVVVEGIYSMDGDMADLPALLEVSEKHGCRMFIDEAHSILAWGEHGRGATEHFGVEDRMGMVFATFSKAFAGVGGFVSGDKNAISYLRYYSHPYGFSCALPPSVVAGLLKVMEIITREPDQRRGGLLQGLLGTKPSELLGRLPDAIGQILADPGRALEAISPPERACGATLRKKMQDNTDYLRSRLLEMNLNLGESTSQVIPIIIGSDRHLLYEMCHEMSDRGLFLAPVDYPSVPEDGLRYRVAVTAAHSRKDLDDALEIIEKTIVPRIR